MVDIINKLGGVIREYVDTLVPEKTRACRSFHLFIATP